jgi:hypothetical protein
MPNLPRSISAKPALCDEHMTDTAIEAVLRHDRAIVAGALFLLAGLAWAYMLWLAADMDMGGMDMSGLRMVPAGMALMMPTTAPSRRRKLEKRAALARPQPEVKGPQGAGKLTGKDAPLNSQEARPNRLLTFRAWLIAKKRKLDERTNKKTKP